MTAFRKKAMAAAIPRPTWNKESTVFPSLSTARYRYPVFGRVWMYVSSTRQEEPAGFARRFQHHGGMRHVYLALLHQRHEVAIAQAVGEIPANAGFDHIAREPPATVAAVRERPLCGRPPTSASGRPLECHGA